MPCKITNYWSCIDYNYDKTFYTLFTCQVNHPRNPSTKTELSHACTFSGIHEVIVGSEIKYRGTSREECLKTIEFYS